MADRTSLPIGVNARLRPGAWFTDRVIVVDWMPNGMPVVASGGGADGRRTTVVAPEDVIAYDATVAVDELVVTATVGGETYGEVKVAVARNGSMSRRWALDAALRALRRATGLW